MRRVGILVAALAIVAAAGVTVWRASGDSGPVEAARSHIEAAKAGDVDALRRGACGDLASAMEQHTDDEVRDEFIDAYTNGPDDLVLSDSAQSDAAQQTVAGIYTRVTDLDIAFVVEDHDGWKVCTIRRGNGIFGPLPGPFETQDS